MTSRMHEAPGHGIRACVDGAPHPSSRPLASAILNVGESAGTLSGGLAAFGPGRSRRALSWLATLRIPALASNLLTTPLTSATISAQCDPAIESAALSWLDAVRVFEQVLGRPILVNHVQAGLMTGFGHYELIVPMDEIAPRFGV
jgi:hypothetical protein